MYERGPLTGWPPARFANRAQDFCPAVDRPGRELRILLLLLLPDRLGHDHAQPVSAFSNCAIVSTCAEALHIDPVEYS